MYVALGFCTAGLIGLAILPAFYRRAARLTEEALRAVNPASYTEVRAAQDQERARYAVELRRVETRLDAEREKAAKFHLEASRLRAEAEALKKDHETAVAALEARVSENDNDQRAVDMLSAEIKTLKQKLSDSEKALADSWTKTAETGTGTEKTDKATPDTGDDQDWLPASDTMALATITGLEAEVAMLKTKLSRYEPTVASEVEASLMDVSRSRLAELEAQLVDTESNYVSAQAEVTRLSLLLDAAGSTETQPDKQLEEKLERLSRESARQQADLQEKERVQKRLTGQLLKLRGELERVPELAELRKEFRTLAQRLSDASDIQVIPETASADTAPTPVDATAAPADTEKATAPVRAKTAAQDLAPVPRKRGSRKTAARQEPAAPPSNGAAPARSADIATAAEALVSRVVASSRKKSKPADEGDTATAATGTQGAVSQVDTGSARKSKSAKQKKKDVA